MKTMALGTLTSHAVIVCAVLATAAPSSAFGVTYRLTQGASYTEGCFEFCACPLWFSPLTGKFRLMPVSLTGTYDTYSVSNINWTVSATGAHITGHGTYTVFNEFAALNRMELDLALSSGQTVHFDSGMVPVGAPWPRIDITVAEHGAPACYDIRLDVDAKPLLGDVTNDGDVTTDDLLAVITHWGDCPPTPDACPADIAPTPTGDHTINLDDLLAVINDW